MQPESKYKYGIIYKISSILKRWSKRTLILDLDSGELSIKRGNKEKKLKMHNY